MHPGGVHTCPIKANMHRLTLTVDTPIFYFPAVTNLPEFLTFCASWSAKPDGSFSDELIYRLDTAWLGPNSWLPDAWPSRLATTVGLLFLARRPENSQIFLGTVPTTHNPYLAAACPPGWRGGRGGLGVLIFRERGGGQKSHVLRLTCLTWM